MYGSRAGVDAVMKKQRLCPCRESSTGSSGIVTKLSRFLTTQAVGIMGHTKAWQTGCNKMVDLCFSIGCSVTDYVIVIPICFPHVQRLCKLQYIPQVRNRDDPGLAC
jgi:hypothetical protein